ncbi:hypothetical protein CC79DRAFT_1337780 [Sarocladium strictum]
MQLREPSIKRQTCRHRFTITSVISFALSIGWTSTLPSCLPVAPNIDPQRAVTRCQDEAKENRRT